MENKILELLEKNGQVSMSNDIFPLLWNEFDHSILKKETYVQAQVFIEQLLYGCYLAGVNVICVPVFDGNANTGSMDVVDMIYKVLR